MPSPSRFSISLSWLLFALTSGIYFLTDNSADNDLWGHVYFGRINAAAPQLMTSDTFSFTAAGAPWRNHEWLGEIIFWHAFQWGGAAGLLAIKLALVGFLLVFLWQRIRRTADAAPVAAFFAVLAVTVLARGCAIRPQLFTYAMTALTMLLVERHAHGHRFALWFLPPLVAVWVNLHGGVIAGVAIVMVYAAWQLVTTRARRNDAAVIAALCAAAMLANPYGAALFASIGTPLVRFLPIGEWQPIHVGDPAHIPFLLMLVLGSASIAANRARGVAAWELTLAIGAAIVAVRQQRHTPLVAIVAVPLITRQFAALVQARDLSLSSSMQRVLASAVALLAVAQLGLTAARFWQRGSAVAFEAADYPVGAVAFLAQSQRGGNIALPLDWGAYVLWHASPTWKVSIDGRLETVYPPHVIEDAFAIVYGWSGWEQVVARFRPDALLLPAGRDHHVRTSATWQPTYADAVAVVYEPRDRMRPPAPVPANVPTTGWLPFP